MLHLIPCTKDTGIFYLYSKSKLNFVFKLSLHCSFETANSFAVCGIHIFKIECNHYLQNVGPNEWSGEDSHIFQPGLKTFILRSKSGWCRAPHIVFADPRIGQFFSTRIRFQLNKSAVWLYIYLCEEKFRARIWTYSRGIPETCLRN